MINNYTVKLLTPEQISVVVDYQDKIDSSMTSGYFLLLLILSCIFMFGLIAFMQKIEIYKYRDKVKYNRYSGLSIIVFVLYWLIFGFYVGYYVPQKQISLLEEQRNYIKSLDIKNLAIYENLIINGEINRSFLLSQKWKVQNLDNVLYYDFHFIINYNKNILCYIKKL